MLSDKHAVQKRKGQWPRKRNVEQRRDEEKEEPEKDTLRIRGGSGTVPPTYYSVLGPRAHRAPPGLLCVLSSFLSCFMLFLIISLKEIEFKCNDSLIVAPTGPYTLCRCGPLVVFPPNTWVVILSPDSSSQKVEELHKWGGRCANRPRLHHVSFPRRLYLPGH